MLIRTLRLGSTVAAADVERFGRGIAHSLSAGIEQADGIFQRRDRIAAEHRHFAIESIRRINAGDAQIHPAKLNAVAFARAKLRRGFTADVDDVLLAVLQMRELLFAD